MSLTTKLRNQWDRTSNEVRILGRGLACRLSPVAQPRVLFFPSTGPEGASLLRAYNMSKALTALGWESACVSPTVRLSGRKRLIHAFRPDLLVYQQVRHALNDAVWAGGVPFVLDTDDADFHLERPDLVARLERTSRQAAGVIAGSRYLRNWHKERCSRTSIIWTGTPISAGIRPRHAEREAAKSPVLAWAQAQPLAYAQELDFVLQVAARLQAKGVHFALRFYGVEQESEGRELLARAPGGIEVQTFAPLPYVQFLLSLRDVAVGLSPIMAVSPFSRGKSFGKILGYLDAKVPVICSDEADHAIFFSSATGVVSNDIDVWVNEAARLLRDAVARDAMADAAFEAFESQLGLPAAARKTDEFLRGILTAMPSVHDGLGLGAGSG